MPLTNRFVDFDRAFGETGVFVSMMAPPIFFARPNGQRLTAKDGRCQSPSIGCCEPGEASGGMEPREAARSRRPGKRKQSFTERLA
jgi:hypothetical protein